MRVIRHLLTTLRRRLGAQDGIVLLYALGAMVVVLGLSGAALAAVTLDTAGTATDSNEKQAYAAAQAGIQRYLFELNTNNTYWTECGAGANWIFNTNQSETPVTVPGSSTETYAVRLLPAAGQTTYTQCSTADPVDSMIQATGIYAGTLRIASTGYAGNAQRTIVAAIRQQNFLDYAYFTTYETADPIVEVDDAFAGTKNADTAIEPPDQCAAAGNSAAADCGSDYQDALTGGTLNGKTYPGATAQCSQYRSAGRESQAFFANTEGSGSKAKSYTFDCTDIQFIAGDQLNGPFHSNDSVLICGTPSFGQQGYSDSVEFGGDASVYPNGWGAATSAQGCNQSSTPKVNGRLTSQDTHLNMPSIISLASVAGYTSNGTTCLNLTTGGVQVAYPTSSQSCATLPLTSYTTTVPYTKISGGVFYVNSGTCNYTYDVDDPTYSGSTGCGTVYVKGTDAEPLTIGAAQDIVIDGNLTYPSPNTTGAMLGLIANGFIRVYHPVNGVCSSSGASNASGFTPITQIDAMMLSLDHSFIVDNYSCGNNLGTLNVYGGIAQNFRGTVGAGSAGYTKNYVYDRRLEYEEPPHFLAPTNGAYAIAHQTECDTPSSCDSTTLN